MKQVSAAAPLLPVTKELKLASGKKPHGYWDDFANVKQELLVFIAQHGTPGEMPTGAELGRSGG